MKYTYRYRGNIFSGVPFGAIPMVKEWLNIIGEVKKPEQEHPKRPVEGLNCKRKEVSGERFWHLIQSVSQVPENFLARCTVYNHCPLAYMGITGKNITPVDMKAKERNEILDICDEALLEIVKLLKVKVIVGIGRYAENRAKKILVENGISEDVLVFFLSHPSPASASSNKVGWETIAREQLVKNDLIKYMSPDDKKGS